MRKYEMIFITEKEGGEIIEKIKSFVQKEAEFIELKEWGKREFAYPIKKRKEGFYYLLEFNALPEFVGKLKDALKFEEDILRFMITKREE